MFDEIISETNNYFKNILRIFKYNYLFNKFDSFIIIYQMGKVGSKSIHNSLLSNANIIIPVFHTHSIRHDSMYIDIKKIFRKINIYRDKVKIITITREPISRNISSFFESIKIFMPNINLDSINGNNSEQIVEQLIKNFFSKFHHTYPLTWYDVEFRNTTGVNIYELELGKKRIYCIDNIELLILRKEDDDKFKEDLIREFFDLEKFNLENVNISDQKKYSNIYSTFLKTINFPKSYLDEMYNSKYTKHFYSVNEIKKFREKWEN